MIYLLKRYEVILFICCLFQTNIYSQSLQPIKVRRIRPTHFKMPKVEPTPENLHKVKTIGKYTIYKVDKKEQAFTWFNINNKSSFNGKEDLHKTITKITNVKIMHNNFMKNEEVEVNKELEAPYIQDETELIYRMIEMQPMYFYSHIAISEKSLFVVLRFLPYRHEYIDYYLGTLKWLLIEGSMIDENNWKYKVHTPKSIVNKPHFKEIYNETIKLKSIIDEYIFFFYQMRTSRFPGFEVKDEK